MVLEHPVQILLVEDDNFDISYAKRGIKQQQLPVTLTIAHDGKEALDIIYQQEEEGMDEPLLILLDLNMPNMDGFTFLERFHRLNDANQHMIFVMTNSDNESDVAKAQSLGVAGILHKRNFHWDASDIKRLLTSFHKHLKSRNKAPAKPS